MPKDNFLDFILGRFKESDRAYKAIIAEKAKADLLAKQRQDELKRASDLQNKLEMERKEAVRLIEVQEREPGNLQILEQFGVVKKLTQIQRAYWDGLGTIGAVKGFFGEITGAELRYEIGSAKRMAGESSFVIGDLSRSHTHYREFYEYYQVEKSSTYLKAELKKVMGRPYLGVDSPLFYNEFGDYGDLTRDSSYRPLTDSDRVKRQTFPTLVSPDIVWEIREYRRKSGIYTDSTDIGISIDHPLAERFLDEALALDVRNRVHGQNRFPRQMVALEGAKLYAKLSAEDRAGEPFKRRAQETFCYCYTPDSM